MCGLINPKKKNVYDNGHEICYILMLIIMINLLSLEIDKTIKFNQRNVVV